MLYEKIIAVDDEMNILTSIRLALERHFEVICFQRGEDALALLRKPNSVNLVLLDVFMKDVDGIDILREIKKINRDIIVIIMTAFGTKDLAIQALRNDADDFIEKPFDVGDLKDKVKDLLRERVGVDDGKERNIEQMKRFIERNYRNVSLRYISDEVCLSTKYASRLFKSRNKCSFRDYKIKVKMDKAKSFLRDSSYTICQISEMLGYQNPESFMRLFKRINKITPTEFRKRKKVGKVAKSVLNESCS